MQVAAHDPGRLRRATGGSAGAAVAAYAGLELLAEPLGPGGRLTATAVALAGAALALLAFAGPGVARRAGRALATVAAAAGVATGVTAPATALATLFACAAVALLDVRLPAARSPLAVPLVAAATLVAGVSALPGVADALPGAMSAPVRAAVLALAGGTFLASGTRSDPPAARAEPPPTASPVPVEPVSPVRSAVPVDSHSPGDRPLARPGVTAALLESMEEAVMVVDANYRVLDVNRRWRELTGHRAEDVIGHRPPYAWTPDTGGEGMLHRVDGTDVPVRATVAAVPDADGRPGAYVATYLDVGDAQAEELVERATELEHGNAQLREANNRLESALTFKNDVMSMLGHDMSQPVTSIFSMSDLLISDWDVLAENDRLDLATRIGQNTHRLIRMMEDLNLLFRLDTGSVTVRRSPIPVREVVETVSGALDAGGIGIAVDDDLSALVDREHLGHVVRNLLTNAVAYGAPPIEITARREADRVVMVVQDHGPGIPEDLVPKLFDRFMRGSGLGLFIVRHLVQANGGSVRYEHADPQGARLVVELEADTPHR